MEHKTLEMVAGFGSSLIFVLSNFPMIAKVVRTRNLKSYSFSQILMANIGNLLYWLYVFGLPVGPIWFLHGFNTAVSILMLSLYGYFEIWPHLALARHSADDKPARSFRRIAVRFSMLFQLIGNLSPDIL